MYGARLGGMQGVTDVRTRRRSDSTLECRGVFAFRSDHESAMVKVFEAGRPVEFEGVVDGEQRRLMVTLMSVDPVSGIALFEGSVESGESHRDTRSQAG